MTEELSLTETISPRQTEAAAAEGDRYPASSRPGAGDRAPADAKQLRVEHVGKLLDGAYQKASELKLSREESKKLREDFPDTAIEIRPHDGIIYIGHMTLRERLWEVFGAGHVAEICRERFMRSDTNEVAVDLVLMIRGAFVGEGVGTAKYYANNPKTSFGDIVESAWSEALRRCCKKFGVGTQVWRPDYVRAWIAQNAVQQNGKWFRRDDPRAQNGSSGRKYPLKPKEQEPRAVVVEVDEEGVPF